MTQSSNFHEDFRYTTSQVNWHHEYIWPSIKETIQYHSTSTSCQSRVFEIGCGNGFIGNLIAELGYEVTGVDTSKSGVMLANQAFPKLRIEEGSAYDKLADRYGCYPIVMSIEVIEHCFYPRHFIKTFSDLLESDGLGVISTPYHGYLKNLALALSGKMDAHFTALRDGGHIKFFSMRTLRILLEEAGFRDIRFIRVGRIPPLAKSMIAVFRK